MAKLIGTIFAAFLAVIIKGVALGVIIYIAYHVAKYLFGF